MTRAQWVDYNHPVRRTPDRTGIPASQAFPTIRRAPPIQDTLPDAKDIPHPHRCRECRDAWPDQRVEMSSAAAEEPPMSVQDPQALLPWKSLTPLPFLPSLSSSRWTSSTLRRLCPGHNG